ncbi:MAG: carbamoyltransferase HypF [Candidatus Methanomethylophilaceae archaeon]|nr:carbamoyltransferase HypF [Candidatus Methanomethylophilaceae archaeon]
MRIVLRGVVQGVGFRPSVHRLAERLSIDGTVWNDGSQVIIDILGDAESFLQELKDSLPPLANIESQEILDIPYEGPKGFHIIPSRPGSKGVGIPTDTAICPRCLEEMDDSTERRYGYPFTSCTDCGPRFTLISDLPYDRRMTSMDPFPLCPDCEKEYAVPSERRYHHQTICCPACGPRYRLFDRQGTLVHMDDPVKGFTERLEEGHIGIVKSWGGMHICARVQEVDRLRRWYRREHKPFAIMVRDEEALRMFAAPSPEELDLVSSAQRPVVLMEKVNNDVTEKLSPGLDNLGIFLPYAGVQHLLFQRMEDTALIMTSANIPGEPMLLDDDSVFSLGADCYLLHDQHILNRADDSVMGHHLGHRHFLRKSRGHTPSYLEIGISGDVVALGGQENISACVGHDGRLYSTQYIGDGDGLGVMEYLDSAVAHLRKLMGADGPLTAVAIDMHPGYSNRALGRRLSQESDCPLLEVQHHWAHAASLLVDSEVDRAVVLTLDGTGYGDDGKAWGGEVLCCDLESYERVGKLQDIPLLGGEKALYDLKRLNFAIDRLNGREGRGFNDNEAAVLERLMDTSVGCSSMGRLMDALSSQLGVCSHRSYDGEPAMKLERLLRKGKRNPDVVANSKNGQIITAPLFAQVEEMGLSPADAAYSVVECVLQEMVQIARIKAEDEGIRHVGLTGGVSYNKVVMDIVSDAVKQNGMNMVLHDRVPNGDGGIAVGQAAIALRNMV